MAGGVTTRRQRLLVCPACKADINASFEIELGELKLTGAELGTVDVKLSGLRVEHDCIRPTPRG